MLDHLAPIRPRAAATLLVFLALALAVHGRLPLGTLAAIALLLASCVVRSSDVSRLIISAPVR